jgi:predicted RNA binding protein YcfA (HicA-like mRNA interferase family)
VSPRVRWPTIKAARVFAALLRIGWSVKRVRGSHKVLQNPGWPDYTFAFHDKEEIGAPMLSRIASHTGLRPEDL